jgi:hypothetical protein
MRALTCAFVAQPVERFLGKEEVAGPIPAEGLRELNSKSPSFFCLSVFLL